MAALNRSSTVCTLVPFYDCQSWLGDTLESLVTQSRPPDAVVVIDDASPEPPLDVVRAFPGVTLLVAADNGGPYRLVQKVIEMTRFDAYLFQDADDWSAFDRLEVLLQTAEETDAEL
ncbi:MAG TPA: glycosyltransferase family 2 protein, partial [Actinomycetes bacterium]|nr:glycosyltransferase family 2 protein [Actinomycetes bacterium]